MLTRSTTARWNRRVCAGRWRRCRCPGPGRAVVLAVDVSPSLRSDAPTSSDRLFCHVYGRGEGSGPIDPGLAVLLRRRHRAGLDVVERATRRDPPRSGRGRHRADRRAAARSTSESTETAEPTETTAEPTETTAEPTASEESNSDAERGADATTGAPENSPSSDAGNLDATSPVTPRPPGPPVAATRRARAAVRAARAPSAPRRDDLLATVRRPPVWSVVHAGSSIVQFGG
jgi:hypothetical protein